MEAGYKQAPDRLERLVRRFGVRERGEQIRRCFELVCGESLRAGAGRSSLNADGTPVQFALSLAAGRPTAFEFVGEALVGVEYEQRRAHGLECMRTLAAEIGAEREVRSVQTLMADIAGTGPAGDCEDPVGAFWIGAAFDPKGSAAMTVYANVRRGEEQGRWESLSAFAAAFDSAGWQRIEAAMRPLGLRPLGAGVRVSAGGKPRARLYFGAYGVKADDYRRAFREAGGSAEFDSELELFFDEALGEDRNYPTRSAVCSFGWADGEWHPKLELCGHCAWTTNDEAVARCAAWLERLGFDAGLYRDVIDILRSGSAAIHAYAGVGMRRGEAYASIYLNPGTGM